MPTIRKVKEHDGDTYTVGQWLRCTTTKASALLATGAWAAADFGAVVDLPEVQPLAEEKSAAPARNKMLTPEDDK